MPALRLRDAAHEWPGCGRFASTAVKAICAERPGEIGAGLIKPLTPLRVWRVQASRAQIRAAAETVSRRDNRDTIAASDAPCRRFGFGGRRCGSAVPAVASGLDGCRLFGLRLSRERLGGELRRHERLRI